MAKVGKNFVKFCDTGNNIVPATSQKIAPTRNKYVFNTIKEYYYFLDQLLSHLKLLDHQ